MYAKLTRQYPLIVLVAANLVPIGGVFLLNWDLFSILFFYWVESGVVGAYNIPKMLMAGKSGQSLKNSHKISGVIFFLVHYSGFMAGHGFAIFELFSPVTILSTTVIFAVISLTVSHGVSFVKNFVIGKEYLKVNLSEQMIAPYKRIVIMHIAIIACGFLLSLFSQAQIVLVLLIVLKIAIDVISHLREHRKIAVRQEVSIA